MDAKEESDMAQQAMAESALRAAEQLKPDSPETHLARANHLYFGLRDYEGAQAQLDIAGRGLPNDSRIPQLKGYIARRKGKAEEGLRLLKQATALDPRNVTLLDQIALSYQLLRQYAEMVESYDRALQIKPDELSLRIFRTEADLVGHADPAPMCQVVEQVRLTTPGSVSDVADNWFLCALSKRDWAAAEQALAALGDNPCWGDSVLQLSRQFGEGLLSRAMHDDARARQAFTAARAEQEQLVQKQKDYGPPLCVLGLIDAALGNKEAALQEGRRAMEWSPNHGAWQDLSHQRHEPTATRDFEFAEDRVEVLFHHRQTQTGVISDLLVTPPFANKARNFLFAPSESDEMRQTGARRRPRG